MGSYRRKVKESLREETTADLIEEARSRVCEHAGGHEDAYAALDVLEERFVLELETAADPDAREGWLQRFWTDPGFYAAVQAVAAQQVRARRQQAPRAERVGRVFLDHVRDLDGLITIARNGSMLKTEIEDELREAWTGEES